MMGLSCECSDYDDDGEAVYIEPNTDFTKLATIRRRRCCSCKKLIDIGADTIQIDRYRSANDDIEERIYRGPVPLAYWYLCGECGEIYLNLSDIGYCMSIGEQSMQEFLAEYHQLTGFVKPSTLL